MLAAAGARVVIVERERRPRRRPGETLPGAVRGPLRQLGGWPAFAAAGHLPSAGIRTCWGGDEPAERDSIRSAWGQGWHIDRQRFEADLLAGAATARAELLTGSGLAGMAGRPGAWRLCLANDSSLDARLVIDASGRRRAVARRLGAQVRHGDRLVGVVGWLAAASPPEHRLLVEAVETGWWSATPLPDSGWAVALMTDLEQFRARALADTAVWRGELRRTRLVGGAVGDGRLSGRLTVADASPSWLEPRSGPGWTAVGDAALAPDPLSGRGIVSALEDAIGLADRLLSSRPAQCRPDAAAHLARRSAYYAIERRWAAAPFWRQRAQNGIVLPSQA